MHYRELQRDEATLREVAALAGLAQQGDATKMFRHAEALQQRGHTVGWLYRDRIEPAIRLLGDQWRRDECSAAELTLGMSMLQMLVRRLGPAFRRRQSTVPATRSVLIGVPPDEPHSVTAALLSEYFIRAGWDVTVAYPNSRPEFIAQVASRHDELIIVCSSGAQSDQGSLVGLGRCIRAARVASCNPGLMVVASGRIFQDDPEAHARIGADANVSSPSTAVRLAEALLRTRETPPRGATRQSIRHIAADVLYGLA